MTDYAHGHGDRPMPALHLIWRVPNPKLPAELHITSETGLHYRFSVSRNQAWSAVRQLTEAISRMSETKPSE